MSWCDKLASTPSVGFGLSSHFASGDAVLNTLAPLLDQWVKNGKQLFKIDKHESFAVGFVTEDGFQYGIDQSKIYVNFAHRMKVEAISGGPPIARLISSPLPFTELLPQVSDRLLEATVLLPAIKDRTVARVGVIASTSVSEDEVPPGIRKLIEYVGQPWKGLLDQFNLQITGRLNEGSASSDRCIHTLVKQEDPEQLLNITFDWQRKFTSERPTNSQVLREILNDAAKDSMAYFEELAEGNRFDADVIAKAT